jgi:phosphatidylserine/phosphatidylglycerophosphate/cardiolipin synthase-like enzyme
LLPLLVVATTACGNAGAERVQPLVPGSSVTTPSRTAGPPKPGDLSNESTGTNAPPHAKAARTEGAPTDVDAPTIELVESVPAETTLDRPDVSNAADVWRTMIDGAKTSIDFAEFYASEAEGKDLPASLLAPVIGAVERAAARNVTIRFLADASFSDKYPEVLRRFRRAGVDVRTIDVGKLSGGVMHAKYFVVDGVDSFVGSQNFDWRALGHIQEMGVRVHSTRIAGALLDILNTDWQLASGSSPDTRIHEHARANGVPMRSGERLSLVASPGRWLPDEGQWDLPQLRALIDHAAATVDVQVLTYKTTTRTGERFLVLDETLRAAAARGVKIRLIVSEWGAKPSSDGRSALDSLAKVPGIEVRVIVIPPFSGGAIPFARVAHAKYMVVDGAASTASRTAWVGTSNWEGDYFTRTRNVGVVAEGGALPLRLAQYFDENWKSAYTQPLASYAPPVVPASHASHMSQPAGATTFAIDAHTSPAEVDSKPRGNDSDACVFMASAESPGAPGPRRADSDPGRL